VAELLGKALLFSRIPAVLSSERVRHSFRSIVPWQQLGIAAGGSLVAAAVVAGARLAAPVFFDGRILEGSLGPLVPLALISALFGISYVLALRVFGVDVLEAVVKAVRSRLPARRTGAGVEGGVA
jgi:hypothetical protein